MKLWEKIVMIILLAAAIYIVAGVVKPVGAQATIQPIVIGQWSVVQGFISTSPEGVRFACEVGDYGEGQSYPFELEDSDVYLRCVPFINDKPYAGKKEGELVYIGQL